MDLGRPVRQDSGGCASLRYVHEGALVGVRDILTQDFVRDRRYVAFSQKYERNRNPTGLPSVHPK